MRFGHLFLALAALGLGGAARAASIYNGNGASGFGGAVGSGSLTVGENGTGDITFTLSPNGTNLGGNDFVLYLDTKTGGVSDTSTLTDEGDEGRRLVSGVYVNNPNNGTTTTRTVATFPAGFGADYGVEFETGVFAGVFDLSTPGNYPFVAGNGIGADGPYSVTVNRSQLGLDASSPLSFVGSLISGSIYRSNETIGPSNVPTPGDGSGNAGFNGEIVFSGSQSYTVPEPTSIAVLGLIGWIGSRRRR